MEKKKKNKKKNFKGEGGGGVEGQIFDFLICYSIGYNDSKTFYGIKKNAFFVKLWLVKVRVGFQNIRKSLYIKNVPYFQPQFTQNQLHIFNFHYFELKFDIYSILVGCKKKKWCGNFSILRFLPFYGALKMQKVRFWLKMAIFGLFYQKIQKLL